MRRYALRDDRSDGYEEILPGREGHVGGAGGGQSAVRRSRSVQISRRRPLAQFARAFGDWKMVYQRFNQWLRASSSRLSGLLASDHDNEYMMIDATIVRARRR